MKTLNVIVAGLGYRLLERNRMTRIGELDFKAAPSVFPAVTCVQQASLRTGLTPAEHGIFTNGVWLDNLRRPAFWEQSAALVKGERIWGKSVGLFFLQQSLGENAAIIVSPAPIHKHSGGMIMSVYTYPTQMAATLDEKIGKFPLHRYWGPLANAKVGRNCIDTFEVAMAIADVDEAYLYLPTLDYAAQRNGPDSTAAKAALKELKSQLERLIAFCEKRNAQMKVIGDYEITPVMMTPSYPNLLLRRNGLFKVRHVAGMAYPDFYQSSAFCICDHEIAMLVGEAKDEARRILLATGEYEEADGDILLAKFGSWCAYPWWTDRREAPDYASHVDIHNKPGFDPTELFFFGRGTVKGTHGRKCEIGYA